MTEQEIENRLAGVTAIVEATNWEKFKLWQENEVRTSKRRWTEGRSGHLFTVGYLADMPVCISVLIDEIDSKKILFWHPTSQVVNHRMITEWFQKHSPASFTSSLYLDANRFDEAFKGG